MSTIGVGKSFHDNARQARAREDRREALREGRTGADGGQENFVAEPGVCVDCGETYGQEHLVRLGDGRYRCAFCEVDQLTEQRLRQQLHTRIGAPPVLAPLGLLLSLPIWLWMYGGTSHAYAGIFLLVPPAIGVLASLVASVDNVRTVLVIDRYKGMLEVRPAERGLLTLSAVAGIIASACVAVVSVLLVLTPGQWRALMQALGL
mgnify:CR=1 FL=1